MRIKLYIIPNKFINTIFKNKTKTIFRVDNEIV